MPKLCAQETASQKHIGAPQDWSQRQIVFSRDALARHPELMDREPRIRQQMMQHWQAPNLGAFDRDGHLPERQQKPGIARDWNVNLGSRMHRDIFPAKFSFDPSAPPDCVNDYVVFGLNVAGVNLGQANLVAFNNLYVNSAGTGFCPGTAPNVLFAYNITTGTSGGKIVTSPVISLDGKKIAFVESAPAPNKSAIFQLPTFDVGVSAKRDFGTDGGVHNFLRYLENWGGQTMYYKGSMVSLFYATYNTGTFKCCTDVYGVPTRAFYFDLDFSNPGGLPPGTPMFRDVNSLSYRQLFTTRLTGQ